MKFFFLNLFSIFNIFYQQQYKTESPLMKDYEELSTELHLKFQKEVEDNDDIFSSEETLYDKTPLLVYNSLYKINSPINPHKYGVNYLKSGKYIDEAQEYQLKYFNNINLTNNCKFDKQKFIESLNLIRIKHQVKELNYSGDLENIARVRAEKIKNNYQCQNKENNLVFGELSHYSNIKLTEKQILQKWYEPAYSYDFHSKNFKNNGINYQSMFLLLWDTVENIGCYRVCCPVAELLICNVFPTPSYFKEVDIKNHILPNKFLK